MDKRKCMRGTMSYPNQIFSQEPIYVYIKYIQIEQGLTRW